VNFSAVQNDPKYFLLKSDLIPSSVSTTLVYNDVISGPLDDVITEFDCIYFFISMFYVQVFPLLKPICFPVAHVLLPIFMDANLQL
jgi:uncharacterized membrane protein YfhO